MKETLSADDSTVRKLLGMKTIAVVGLSKAPSKPSHDVAKYLLDHGYQVIPINPTVDKVLGLKSYSSLSDLPDEVRKAVDVVDIFRRSEDIPPIVDEAISLHNGAGHPTAIWMQLGIVNEEAARKAKAAGMDVVMDRCMKIEHSRFRN